MNPPEGKENSDLNRDGEDWDEDPPLPREHDGLLFPGTEKWSSKPANRRFLVIVVILAIFLPLTLPFAYREVKGRRACDLVLQSSKAFASGDIELGSQLLGAAYRLAPGNSSVQQAMELYNAARGDNASLEKLLTRLHSGLSDNNELLGIAEMDGSRVRQIDRFEALHRISGTLSSEQIVRQALIVAAQMAEKGDIAGAASYCLSKGDATTPEYAGRLKTQGAFYLLSLHHEADSLHAITILQEVARSHSSASIAAWRMLAQMVFTPLPETKNRLSSQAVQELVALLPQLHGALFSDVLRAADIEILADPSHEEAVVNMLMSKYANADRQEMLQLAWWLNAKTLYAKTIAYAGEDRPRNDTEWLLIVLCAHDALGHGEELIKLVSYGSGQGIPEAMRYLILARSATLKGDKKTSDEAWGNVDEYLYLEKSATLANLATFEEHIGELDHARRAYREMADRSETKVEGLTGLVRLQSPTASAESLIPLYEELTKANPNSIEAMEDLIYLKFLSGKNTPQDLVTADKLLEAKPHSLACLSIAALAHLKNGDFKGAAQLYEGKSIDWATGADPWKAIRSAVLRKNGDPISAEAIAASIDLSKLRPESQMLLQRN